MLTLLTMLATAAPASTTFAQQDATWADRQARVFSLRQERNRLENERVLVHFSRTPLVGPISIFGSAVGVVALSVGLAWLFGGGNVFSSTGLPVFLVGVAIAAVMIVGGVLWWVVVGLRRAANEAEVQRIDERIRTIDLEMQQLQQERVSQAPAVTPVVAWAWRF